MADFLEDIAILQEMLAKARRGHWCGHCKFWEEFDRPESYVDYDGRCHRRPPERVPDDESGWPTTRWFDWCGEYALNKTPALARYIEELTHAQPTDEQP